MQLSQQKFFEEIDILISKGQDILKTKWRAELTFRDYVDVSIYKAWWIKIKSFLGMFLASDNTYMLEVNKLEQNSLSNLHTCIQILTDIKDYVEKGHIPLVLSSSQDVSALLNTVFSKFHRVARQLRTRYNNRGTLEINDEYDVQDLLHALLQLYFDDIRKEEWTPSYAGGSSRQDFLLKNEKIVIEVKKTRASMTDRNLGEQLIIDIEKYKNHPGCNLLICFVYDPEGILGNPQGIMNDLNTKHKSFAEVIIKPD